ncbi:glycosyl transferase family 1 [Sorangium cellulosum]|uniref:Glycosyl transferase family 1 n=1 Tax=Sorangium cellulosum TaxID=56 RepID=A0A2L0F545_SORCE|nr:glycosyltransferase family 4 protein [Sorangium cellulosum]AUX46621.1 glycosyl transferase family 1 [Sorangium cellulosum]
MRLTVLHVGYPLAPVGPDAVGGAEQVLSMLDEALSRGGHRSIVVAPEGSSCAGTLVATPAPPQGAVLDDAAKEQAWRHHRSAIARALDRYPVDLVHLHGVDFDRYLPDPGVPVLVTLHLPPSFYSPSVFRLDRPDTFLHCVSATQRRVCPPGAPLLPEIPNGVRLEHYRPRRHKRGYAIALGRICPEKGYHVAAEAALRAGVPLLVAGQAFGYAEHTRYLEEVLLPLLRGAGPPRRFLGPVGLARKRRLLAAARCLLVPSLVQETSSLVAMEALASGTPVIALRGAGALPEIVEHGRTGFLVEGAEGMAEAMSIVDRLDPAECRRAAEERFSAERTAAAYIETYRRILGER